MLAALQQSTRLEVRVTHMCSSSVEMQGVFPEPGLFSTTRKHRVYQLWLACIMQRKPLEEVSLCRIRFAPQFTLDFVFEC